MTVDEAAAALRAAVTEAAGWELVAIGDGIGRVLAESVVAPRPIPGHTNAAVDGYAIRRADLGEEATGKLGFRIVGESFAGVPWDGTVGPGEAVRIMTGAIVPGGADSVIMLEAVELVDGEVRIEAGPPPRSNVRPAGEDMQFGETVMTAGRWLTPADIGLLASLGSNFVRVRRRIDVGVLSTGSEVNALGRELAPGTLYDSNRYMLMAALQRLGAVAHDLGIVPDDYTALHRRLHEASQSCDVIITTGGVSAGEADLVRPVLSELGKVEFWRVAMKPGHPFAFGRIGGSIFFGLPGNPVAAIVSFYWLVTPALEQCMGIRDRPLVPLVAAEADTDMSKKAGRMEFHRAILRVDRHGEYKVKETGDQGSGILKSMHLANGLVVLATERGPVQAGDCVPVLPFSAIV